MGSGMSTSAKETVASEHPMQAAAKPSASNLVTRASDVKEPVAHKLEVMHVRCPDGHDLGAVFDEAEEDDFARWYTEIKNLEREGKLAYVLKHPVLESENRTRKEIERRM